MASYSNQRQLQHQRRPVTPERYDSYDEENSTLASSAYEELQMRHQRHRQYYQHQQQQQQQQQAQARKRRQGESPTSVGSVEDDLLSSVERFGELILSSCGMEDCIGPGGGGGGTGGNGCVRAATAALTTAAGASTNPRSRPPPAPRPASPTLSIGSKGSVSLNSNYSPDLFAGCSPPSSPAGSSRGSMGGHARPPRSSSASSPLSSVVHSRAFPPLLNTVSSVERFQNGTAEDVVSAYFHDRAARSMGRFHMERGDDAVRFGRWTRLPMAEYRLDRAQSDVSTAAAASGFGGVGGGGGQHHRPTPSATATATTTSSLLDAASASGRTRIPPSPVAPSRLPSKTSVAGVGGGPSLSLLGDVPPFLLSRPAMERHGTFRTPVRVPAAGMSVTEVSMVQRLFHLSGKKSQRSSSSSSIAGSKSGGDDNTIYVIESVLRLLDVPYSDRFRVVMRQTISTEQWTTVAAEPTIDECLACSIPLMSGMTNRHTAAARETPSGGRSTPLSSSSMSKVMSSANVRLEFEIQFHRTCMYEDRIRRMLTKKINKLMLSWCLWAQDGWAEDQRAAMAASVLGGASSTRMCMGVPLASLPAGACSRLASGCVDSDNGSVVSGGGGTSSANARGAPRPKKWQSLSKRNDSFLLWSMTDIDEQDDEDDVVIEDEGSLASDMSNVGLHRLEWRNRSLTGKEHVSSIASTSDTYAAPPAGLDVTPGPSTKGVSNENERSSHRGQGIELCLSDDEDYAPALPPRSPRVTGTSLPAGIANGLSPHGVEVVYVSDGTIDSPVVQRSRNADEKVAAEAAAAAAAAGEISLPDLHQRMASAASTPTLGKPRSKGGFQRRKHVFGRKKPKVLDDEETDI